MTTEPDPLRRRVVEWEDPLIGAAQAKTLGGLEYLNAMIAGRIPPPPIAVLMNLELVSASHGTAVFTCTPDESVYNPIGAVHGGFMCTALDSALGCAVHSTLRAGQGYTSLEIKVNYLRALNTVSGTLTVTGTVTKPGSRIAFAEGVVTDSEGRTVATASSTLLVFEA
ncbi:uncharacterized domain 1-containing protein [Agreia bicolorata]|uniref:Aromatic compound degradation protein PaaI n=1 Tax=Agreia bicolorata TaxID=110935 RepID=A0A1T4X745_9MICO|nr:PaaI family thioesterase [Agreia bicolorata]KJC63278.1 aromatic compound degradation protein PaaI [Agreia bicolorata]SKA84681.1 uncharacterized domain 1-containing protein [Agreia bicolorata]